MSKHKHLATAHYARGILTLDLPGATEPTLWRQEIKQISTLSFALQTLSNAEQALVLRAAGGAEQIVATFQKPEAADAAMAALRKTVFSKRKGGWLGRILWLVLLGLVLWFVGQVALQTWIQVQLQSAQTNAAGAMPAKPELPEGIPVPADQYLTPPAGE
jgi:hypothetical protein